MAVVIDAAIAIARRLRDRPGTPYADAVIERGGLDAIIVPEPATRRSATVQAIQDNHEIWTSDVQISWLIRIG